MAIPVGISQLVQVLKKESKLKFDYELTINNKPYNKYD